MKSLTKLFCDLVQIPSPSGSELAVGKFVKQYLAEKGIKASFDDTAKETNCDTGNLIAHVPGNKDLPTLLFAAHLDTVEKGDNHIKPQIKNGIIRSDGTTILGADDKAGVACLMEVLAEVKSWENHPPIVAAFTTTEETGWMGSSVIKIPEKIDYCINLDGPSDLGVCVYQTLGITIFKIKIMGKAAHAAVEPEKGINAMKAASHFIAKLPLGKNAKGDTLNIGSIQSGQSNNIVPDEAILWGEVRSFTDKGLDRQLAKVKKTLEEVCKKYGCTFELEANKEDGVPPAMLDKKHPIIDLVKHATHTVGLPFSLEKATYTTDGNFLSHKYPTVTFSQGGKNPHAFDEYIKIADLEKSKELLLEIIRETMN